MQELLLLRHAEATPRGPGQNDGDRSLTVHGETQALAVGNWLKSNQLLPDLILCSPALRTRTTCAKITSLMGATDMPAIEYLDDIYAATPGTLLGLIAEHGKKATRLLLIGHNPGVERLLPLLCAGRSNDYRGFSSATLAQIKLNGPVEPGSGHLLHFRLG